MKVVSSYLVCNLLCSVLAHSAASKAESREISPNQISLYQVPLVCPAAPQIGCGSRAKPILLALEEQPAVAEAWLNRSGTELALVWKAEAKRKYRASALKAVSEKEGLETRELRGAARETTLKDFLSGQGWFRASDVDRLSEQEAEVLAARLVRRIEARVPVSEEQAEAIRAQFTAIFKRRLTGAQDSDAADVEARLINVLRRHLPEKDVAVLEETLPRNVIPLPGEK